MTADFPPPPVLIEIFVPNPAQRPTAGQLLHKCGLWPGHGFYTPRYLGTTHNGPHYIVRFDMETGCK